MSGEDVIEAEGVVIEMLAAGRFRVELANHHRLTGFVPLRRQSEVGDLAPGNRVQLELSPFDLSRGRIRRRLE